MRVEGGYDYPSSIGSEQIAEVKVKKMTWKMKMENSEFKRFYHTMGLMAKSFPVLLSGQYSSLEKNTLGL